MVNGWEELSSIQASIDSRLTLRKRRRQRYPFVEKGREPDSFDNRLAHNIKTKLLLVGPLASCGGVPIISKGTPDQLNEASVQKARRYLIVELTLEIGKATYG